MSSIKSFRDVLNSNSYSNRKVTEVTSIAIAIEDQIMDSVSDIITPEYRLWYIKRLRVVGKHRFLEAAHKARKYGKDPGKLFGHLLK